MEVAETCLFRGLVSSSILVVCCMWPIWKRASVFSRRSNFAFPPTFFTSFPLHFQLLVPVTIF